MSLTRMLVVAVALIGLASYADAQATTTIHVGGFGGVGYANAGGVQRYNEPYIFDQIAGGLCGATSCTSGSTFSIVTTNSTSIKLYLEGREVGATAHIAAGASYVIYYSLDSAAYIALGTYKQADIPVLSITGLTDGLHTMSLYSVIQKKTETLGLAPTADVEEATKLSFTWNVDTEVPTTTITNVPASINNVATGSKITGVVVTSSKPANAPSATKFYTGYLVFYCSLVKSGSADSFSTCNGVDSAGNTLKNGIVAVEGLKSINATYTIPSGDGTYVMKAYAQWVPYCGGYCPAGSDCGGGANDNEVYNDAATVAYFITVPGMCAQRAFTGGANDGRYYSDQSFGSSAASITAGVSFSNDGTAVRDWTSTAYKTGESWVYDGTAPTVVITKSPTGSASVYSKAAQFYDFQTGKFEFSCNDAHSCTYQCSVNGKDSYISNSTTAKSGTFACTSPVNVYFKPTGTTAFTMTATDAAGNVSPWSKVYRIYTDNTGPVATFVTNAYDSTQALDSTNADVGYYPTQAGLQAPTTYLGDAITNNNIISIIDGVINGAIDGGNSNDAGDIQTNHLNSIAGLYDTVLEVQMDITKEVWNLADVPGKYGTILAYRKVNGLLYANVLLATQSTEGTLSFECSHPEFLN